MTATPSVSTRSARAATVGTPDGPFTVVVGVDAVLASGWTDDVDALVALVHPSMRPESVEQRPPGSDDADALLARALDAVTAYYAGDLAAPAAIPVRQRSGEFREHAWDVLRGIGPGEVVTYTQYAQRSGRPAAVRAAAGACAMNAAALFVPCHRVLRTDGSLGGFRYGLPVKESLLGRERALDALF
ncbi:methylated-DNA/protein-cysteinemethyltransferase [Xylanimonas cellulosilytica DSM 15894]|uniref:Methylated-DNA/protein-cysteinemethyltransferase n=1 Tax=Xylanimonas cellulosilytica (strain DSM 15894 / JCM 12276 / CECT 5975 / KCTC 9989 / LMG 20990 / NBRC 107835 / XIL07) TaxID=446471 RepID=D1C0H8_XYLCX|nr:methylated-DNA--[protein]-cysteine S-methyltransferase [Xylanimonas cellulosilytica]ACZ32181.1 methylated-DNA/protein-cysteinemethyltransferase [Xylanimonas cellulosilytica DSM 15894]